MGRHNHIAMYMKSFFSSTVIKTSDKNIAVFIRYKYRQPFCESPSYKMRYYTFFDYFVSLHKNILLIGHRHREMPHLLLRAGLQIQPENTPLSVLCHLSPILYCINKFKKTMRAIPWAGRCFGVVLHREYWKLLVRQPLNRSIVQVDHRDI